MVWRQRLVRWQVVALLGLWCLPGAHAETPLQTVQARMRQDITFLASDRCEGRGPGTKGLDLAAEYIANEFKKAGLKPGGPEGSYFQPFTVPGATPEGPNYLRLRGPQGQEIELKAGEQFDVLGLSHSGQVTAPLVFVGYGASTGQEFGYDDYEGLDVAGKVVVVLRDTPRAGNKFSSFDGSRRRKHASFTEKLQNAEKHKAAAIIFVNDRDTTAQGDDELLPFSYLATSRNAVKLPAVQLRRAVLDMLLRSGGGTSLGQVEEDIDRDLKPHSAVLAGWTASLEVHVNRGHVPLKNVVGVLEGSGKLANETVVIGSHYDHLGYGGFGTLNTSKRTAIHHGADDNGSGTTTVMELARRFARLPHREGRRLVFMTFSGEELGLLGSLYYSKQPLYPLADTTAMVNLDMVGRLRTDPATKKDKLLVEGAGSSKHFDELLESLNKKYDFKLVKKPGSVSPNSDHYSFYAKQIPVVFFWTDYHADYHRPTDTSDKINVPGMARIADLTEDVIGYLATVPGRPDFIKGKDTTRAYVTGQMPRIGIRPSYGDEKDGVLLEGVSSGGPAQKAGLKEGDRIVEVAGKPVKNLEAYMSVLVGLKKGGAIELGILRDGKKMTVKVTPE